MKEPKRREPKAYPTTGMGDPRTEEIIDTDKRMVSEGRWRGLDRTTCGKRVHQ